MEPNSTAIEVMVARKKGRLNRPAAMALATETRAGKTGEPPDAADFERMRRDGEQVLRQQGAQLFESRRVEMLGIETMEVIGKLGDDLLSVRILRTGRRKFQFRCLAQKAPSECEPAFALFTIADRVDKLSEAEAPGTLHLRDARFGFAFDAPDDSWRATGPRSSAGGAQVVWIWTQGSRQVDVQALDLSALPKRPTEATFASLFAERIRGEGASVSVGQSVLAGKPCHHLEITLADGTKKDLFILFHGNTNYSVLITQPTRDLALVSRVKKGFQLTSP